MELNIAIMGAVTSIIIAIIGALVANKNSISLQLRKLKEDHYVTYIEALHNLASDNKSVEYLKKYTLARDKMFIIASGNVVKKILRFEEIGVKSEKHDEFLTELIKEIRNDLKVNNRDFPTIYLKKH